MGHVWRLSSGHCLAHYRICHILCWWTDKVLNGVNLCGFYRPSVHWTLITDYDRFYQKVSSHRQNDNISPYLLMDECTDFVHSSNGLIGTYLYMYIFSHLPTQSTWVIIKISWFFVMLTLSLFPRFLIHHCCLAVTIKLYWKL